MSQYTECHLSNFLWIVAELGEEYEDLQRRPTYDKDEHDDTHHLNNLAKQKPLQYHYLFKSKSIELNNYLQ